MTRTLSFVVPGAPVPCARARVYRDPKTLRMRGVTPAKTRAYESRVRTCAAVACNQNRFRPLAGPVRVTLHIYRAKRVGDWDNYAKAVMDGMNGIAFLDDRQIVEATVCIHDGSDPCVKVYVEGES